MLRRGRETPELSWLRRQSASDLGFLAGFVTFLAVLLPAAICAWYASASLAGVGAGPAGTSGVPWLVATVLFLALPLVVGVVVGHAAERHAGSALGAVKSDERTLVAR